MNFWDFARGPASVKVVLEFGLARGFSQDDLLARSRIAPQHLQDPNFELSALQELRVVENLLRLAGHPPGLGLQVGQAYRFSTFGLWGYGLVCSATVGEAMARALRFIPLSYAFSVVEQRIEDGLCLLQMRPPDLAPGLSRFLVERDLAAAASLVLEVGGPGLQLQRVELQGGRGRAHRPCPGITQLGGAPVRWDGEGYCLGFDARWLPHPLPSANPISAAMCDELCAKLVERWRVREGTKALVQQVMAATPGDSRPSVAALAVLTSTSERTLRRRLQAEGTSYREVRAAALAEQARELLRDPALPITRIAERLGYADLSSFSQAFKRWQGQSPAAYRRSLGGPGGSGR